MKKCCAVSLMGVLLISLCHKSAGQERRIKYREKKIQLSSVPGISTAGLESAKYSYLFSFNLFSGISAGTKYFSVATISNLGTRASSGIQLAGFANVVGTHSYLHLTNVERKQLESEGKTPNQKGIQLSGALNFVRGESSGIQITGGINNVYGSSSGFHLAGLSNAAGTNVIGVQFSSLFNYAGRLTIGSQVSLFNYTGATLTGFQAGLINRVKELDGRASNGLSSSLGLQLGLFNSSRKNNGIQIGLVNQAKKMTGVQIGLINIFSPGPYNEANRRNGVPIGLINIGSIDSRLKLSRSDVIPSIIEFTTGNCHNCTFTKSRMPLDDHFYKTNQNSLIIGYDHWNESEISWAFGYGFHRVYYNKNSMAQNDSNNKRIYLSPGIRLIHLNQARHLHVRLSLLTQIRFELGMRLKKVTFFAGGTANSYWYRGRSINRSRKEYGKHEKVNFQIWPGYVYGVKLQLSSPPRDSFSELVKFLLN